MSRASSYPACLHAKLGRLRASHTKMEMLSHRAYGSGNVENDLLRALPGGLGTAKFGAVK